MLISAGTARLGTGPGRPGRPWEPWGPGDLRDPPGLPVPPCPSGPPVSLKTAGIHTPLENVHTKWCSDPNFSYFASCYKSFENQNILFEMFLFCSTQQGKIKTIFGLPLIQQKNCSRNIFMVNTCYSSMTYNL